MAWSIRCGTSGRLISAVPRLAGLASAHGRSRKSTALAALGAYDQTVDWFPSLVIGANGALSPQGSFAEMQAQYLLPNKEDVRSLESGLTAANMGVVAHYYMDVELQGVLSAVQQQRRRRNVPPRIAIADSLAMGDHAVKMCQQGVSAIACLGVDFMAESVATIMARNGFARIPVYRATAAPIGCSLAESAERLSYTAWLERGRTSHARPLHVVYINTSLETKALSSSILPTITCTSSNVMKTILQASAQITDLTIMYGPDTYMGNNIVSMLDSVLKAGWDDARIARDLHPHHDRMSIRLLRDSIHVFPFGNCIVHHMFGKEVVNAVRRNYENVFVTAHLEVPGEMFQIAMEKSLQGTGIVGSTSDILKFITNKVTEAAAAPNNNTAGDDDDGSQQQQMRRLKFILGTEAGMVTSIVTSVQDILEAANCNNVEAEIVFPVSSKAAMSVDDSDLAIVPGVAGGEGCSTAGGCATCPFMKMNDLDALNDIVHLVSRKNNHDEKSKAQLMSHLPPDRLRGKMIGGVSAIDLGSEPILFMRELMNSGVIPDSLVQKITATSTAMSL